MINLTISEAMTAADGQLVHCEDPAYIGDMFIEGITLDSRKVKPDWLFIADKGERADGHDYVESARRSGAAAAVVEHELDIPIPQILVENSLRAMQRIARLHTRKERREGYRRCRQRRKNKHAADAFLCA